MNKKQELCNYLIKNNLVKEMDIIKHSYSNERLMNWDKRGVESNNMMPCLSTRPDCFGIAVNEIEKVINPLKGMSPYGWHFEQNVYDTDGITRSLKASQGSGNMLKIIEEKSMNNLRIRKLTPKECWRLMGFDDDAFEKAEKVNSNAQLYKQAGNSIVVNVLERILENLIEKDEHIKILELFGGIDVDDGDI